MQSATKVSHSVLVVVCAVLVTACVCLFVKAPFLLQFRVLRTCNRDEHRDAFVTELLHRLDDTSEKETFFRANSACISAKPLCLPTRVTNNDESQQNSKASSFVRSMIFKLNDDVRQDMLAVQLITLCQCIFRRAQLPLYLRPYFVGPYRNCPAKRSFSSCSYTTLEKRQLRGALGGMIEVIPDTMSRHELGVSMECSLSDYFALRFGVGATSDIMNDSKAVCCEKCVWGNACMACMLFQARDPHVKNVLSLLCILKAHIRWSVVRKNRVCVPAGNFCDR